jgi:hypothetical protein
VPAGEISAPDLFQLPAEWEDLEQALGDLDRTDALKSVLEAMRQRATLAMLEYDYIDRDFRDEYINYYATIYRTLPNRCRRLHFFSAEDGSDRYLGYCVLRPIRSRPVCRTVIAPPDDLAPYISCLTTSTVRPHGSRLRVVGFPFMEQDAQYGVCAHASIWMAALYHHLTNQTPRRFLSDVAKGAAARPELFRVTPSGGLSEDQVGAAFAHVGLPVIPYALNQLPAGESVSQIACRYLNSRLPVVLTTADHVTVLIGYGRDRSGRLFYIRSDEGEGPYVRIYASDDPLGAWNFLLVPVPDAIYLSGESAEADARRIFRGLLRQPEHAVLNQRMPDDLRLRTYVTQAGDYKIRAQDRGFPDSIQNVQRFVKTSHWIWVVELQDPALAEQTRRCVLGEIAIDATSDPLDTDPLFGYLPGEVYVWFDGRELPTRTHTEDAGRYLSATAVHDAPSGPPVKRPLGTRIRSHAESPGADESELSQKTTRQPQGLR